MDPQALKKAVAGPTKEMKESKESKPLRADGAARIDVARDDRWPPKKTIVIAAAAAALVWAVALIPLVLHAGN